MASTQMTSGQRGHLATFAEAARRTGLADSAAGMSRASERAGVVVRDGYVDLAAFAGASADVTFGAVTVLEVGAL